MILVWVWAYVYHITGTSPYVWWFIPFAVTASVTVGLEAMLELLALAWLTNE